MQGGSAGRLRLIGGWKNPLTVTAGGTIFLKIKDN
jgi:hypothetical protein